MKKITGLVIILAVLLLGSYYGMGVITERTLKNNLATVNQSNGLYAEIETYNRGLFESQAYLNWNLHVPARLVKSANGQMESVPAQDYRVKMPLTIYHGPVMFSDRGIRFGLGYAHTDITLPSNLLEQFNTFFTKESTQPQMDISLLVDYLNNSEIEISVPQFNLIAKQGKVTFDWLGMFSSVKSTSSLSNVDGHFALEGVRFAQDKVSLVLGKVSGKYDLHRTDAGLFFGQASTLVPSVLVKNDNDKLFEVDEFLVSSNTDIQDDLFSAFFKSSLDKAFVNGIAVGPGRVEVAVKNLDATVLASINAQINKSQQGNDLEKQQALLGVLPQLPQLFARGAVFEISTVNLVVPQGTVDGNVSISLPAGNLANPFEIIQKIKGSGQFKLPVPLVKDLVTESLKQKLMTSALAAQQKVDQTKTQQPVTAGKTEGNTVAASAVETGSAPSLADINQQAVAQTDQQISEMLKSGLLAQQGTDYILVFQLNQGQLIVNGKPFNPAMLKF